MADAPHLDAEAHEDPSYYDIVWTQFRKRRVAYASLWAGVGLLLLAIYAPLLASNKPLLWKVSGDGPLAAGWQSPWLTSLFDRNFFESTLDLFFNALLLPGTLFLPVVIWYWRRTRARARRPRRRQRRRFLLSCATAWALIFAAILAFPGARPKLLHPDLAQQLRAEGREVTAVFPPLPYSFRDVDLQAVRAPISAAHPLGTDNAGRDVMTRLIYGTRISLTVGIFAVLLYIVAGTVLGALAGYYGGRADAVISRLIEVVISIPSLFLILSVAAFIENRSIFHIMVIIAAVSWTTPARLVRAEFLRLRNLDFVAAARAAGYAEAQIIFRQILPNALGPVLVTATFGVASSILVESTMSFLGLGDITVPSWGQILNTGRTTGMWTLILAPGFAIFVTVSLLNLLGEGMRDALDPKMRQ
jgi:peptide/nickel transport system permease protein